MFSSSVVLGVFAATNYVTNGSFESHLSGWSAWGTNTGSVTFGNHSVAYDGDHCVVCSNGGGTNALGYDQNFTAVDLSDIVGFGVYVKGAGDGGSPANNGWWGIYITYNSTEEAQWQLDLFNFAMDDWTLMSGAAFSTLRVGDNLIDGTNLYTGVHVKGVYFVVNDNNANWVMVDALYVGEQDASDVVPTSDSIDDTITNLSNWFINLAVLLIPAAFLGIFCKMGKWGFIIGLAVGAGLGFAFLTTFPLWLLVLIAVGELGLAYQTVSRGG